MTIGNRTSFEPSDICTAEIICKCGTIVAFPVEKWSPRPLMCPNAGCGEVLIQAKSADGGESTELHALASLENGLKQLISKKKELPFSIRLVLRESL